MTEYRAKYREKGHDPVGNGSKWLLLIREEGIRFADLKEKNEKTSSFRPAGVPLFDALPCWNRRLGVAGWIRSST